MINFDEKEARRIKLKENTSYYIENYLNPYQKWGYEVSAKKRIDSVRYADVNWWAISDHIKGMNYQDFLATPYWKAIAAHTKYRAGYRCQLCNNGAKLSTHHRNYAVHGREHAHLNDLIVLCSVCHQKFHGAEVKISKSEVKEFNSFFKLFVIIVSLFFLFFLKTGIY